MMHDILVMLTR